MSEREEKPRGRNQDALSTYCVNLNKKAIAGKIDPLIGRDSEIERTIQILCRRTKNNPLYVGDPGVGKTAIAEGLAKRIVEGDVPEVLAKIHHLRARHGCAAGGHAVSRRFRGAAESGRDRAGKPARGGAVHRRDPHGHRGGCDQRRRHGCVQSAEARAGQRLAALHRQHDLQGIPQYFEKDRALVRRFQKIDVKEPSLPKTRSNPQGAEDQLRASTTRCAIRTRPFVRPSNSRLKYINDRKLPDKAIDVIDEVGASRMLLPEAKRRKTVTLARCQGDRGQDRDDGADPAQIGQCRRQGNARNLERDLKSMVFGQDKAIEALSAAIKLSRAGLRDGEKPIGNYLFSRPDRRRQDRSRAPVGVNTRGIELIRFDMSEYMERHSVSRV